MNLVTDSSVFLFNLIIVVAKNLWKHFLCLLHYNFNWFQIWLDHRWHFSNSLLLFLTVITQTPTAARTPASTPVPTKTVSPTPTPNPHRKKCYKWSNSFYCTGQHTNMKAVCKYGFCVCTGQGYNYDTCLRKFSCYNNEKLIPQILGENCFFCSIYADYYSGNFFISSADAYGCKIEVNSATALAKAEYKNHRQRPTYSCTPASSSTQYEVHILTVYEVINRRPPTAGNAIVNIVSSGKSNRPIVLVLGSYEPVNWILKLPAGISISKVILVSTLS